MSEYKGIISGIGDKQNLINVIDPQFDAKIYQYIINREAGIISGFTLSDNTLRAGVCFAQGYRGEIEQDIVLPQSTGYVYGKFVVYHDKNKIDTFSIEYFSPESADTPFANDDILHNAGTYYLLLYKNGVLQVQTEFLCPFMSEKSIYTTRILSGGSLENNVTCPTAPANSNNKVVANTEYVNNEIEEKIGYAFLENQVYRVEIPASENEAPGTVTLTITAKRRSKLAVINSFKFELLIGAQRYCTVPMGKVLASLPTGFAATESVPIITSTDNSNYWNVAINTKGEIYMANDLRVLGVAGSQEPEYAREVKYFGYETK